MEDCSTVFSIVLEPVELKIKTLPVLAFMEYFPSKSEMVLICEPFTTIFAPGIGIPLESVIDPLTILFCASVVRCTKMEKIKINKWLILFFIRIDFG
ncbi:hypothetical protein D3C87_1190980 [compost metagenome]